MTIYELLRIVQNAGHTTLVIDDVAVHVTLQADYDFSKGLHTEIQEVKDDSTTV